MDPAPDPRDPSAPRPGPASPLTVLAGVGPARSAALAQAGLRSLRDLWLCLPRAAREAQERVPIAVALAAGGPEVRIGGRVERVTLQRFRGRATVRVRVSDASGTLTALYFNQPWQAKSFRVGEEVELAGRIAEARGAVLLSPRVGREGRPLASSGAVQLAYPDVAGVGAGLLARFVAEALRIAPGPVETLTPSERARFGLDELGPSLARVHAPADLEQFARARRRVQLERSLELQAGMLERARRARTRPALQVELSDPERAGLLAAFPFRLTAGQERIAAEFEADLARGRPMRRLLQGDVGSGKTALGLYAAMLVARAGGQTAFLAPTEILAEQHFLGLGDWLARAGLHAVLLTGSLRSAERRAVLAQLASGMTDVAFGTHALFSEDVRYRALALAVIDEQQRFGVAQRQALLDKGRDAHVLLMTATPIPRTLALSLYGDLDTSILREKPAGRGGVRTRWLRGAERKRVPEFLDARLAAGERVYWVTPRIGAGEDGEEALESGRASAEAARERLSRSALARHGIELVHGRMPAEERARRLARFKAGEARLLVATTVIEVGVDVPEATVLVVESAERLGLAQLHQLRGRVGRGPKESWCLLFGDETAGERLRILERTHDGFEIAEEDLRQRGMGDLGGVRQAGEGSAGTMDPAEELELLLAARELLAGREELAAHYAGLARAATP